MVLGGKKWEKVGAKPMKAMFRGSNQLTLDAKGRMVMPTEHRELLQERCGGKLVVTIEKLQCLLIYPFPVWEEVERKIMRLPTMNVHARQLQQMVVGNAKVLDLDSHGRILLPAELREFAFLTRDAVLVGQGTRFELWDETRWKKYCGDWVVSSSSKEAAPVDFETLSF